MLLDSSRKRYIQLHPEFESKMKGMEKTLEETQTKESPAQGKQHVQ